MVVVHYLLNYFVLYCMRREIKDIEHPIIDYNIFNNLAYGQWTLKEMETGEAWESISQYKD